PSPIPVPPTPTPTASPLPVPMLPPAPAPPQEVVRIEPAPSPPVPGLLGQTSPPPARRPAPEPPAPSVWVIGLVERPGHYPLERVKTLSGALRAAGRRPGADLGAVEIERRLPQGRLKSVVDAAEITRGALPDVPLQAGDSVTVPGVNW
ncbi:MAG: hypothetical protein ACREQY_16675, partial [Candidatus Binatia bacterium]